MQSISAVNQSGAAPFSESALIRAAQQGDHDAFEQLVRLHDRAVLRVALSLLRSQEDARDAYQEIFLRVYRRLDSFHFESSFHTWLYRIATNVCLDVLRRRRVRHERPATTKTGEPAGRLFEQTPDGRAGSDPERVLSGRKLAASIALAMDNLTPKERVVFELKHYEGLRLRVIGDMLSISEEAAKNCLFRATRKLRSALKDVES